MVQSLASSMQVLWHRHEILANNLANSATAGFKQDEMMHFTGSPLAADVVSAASGTTGVGGHTMAHWTDFSQSTFHDTGRDLDVAIDGPGFLVVATPRGPRYTRSGALAVSRDGFLVTGNGEQVLGYRLKDKGEQVEGDPGPIAIRSAKVTISAQGEVRDGGKPVAKLQVVDFPKPYPLVKEGDGSFAIADPAVTPAPAVGFQLQSGTLEESNVNPVRTMAQMIEMLRQYESAQRVIQASDEADRTAANDMGRV